jgi:choice-of-anchor B domain-containing protein
MTGFAAAIAVTGRQVFVGRPGELPTFPMPPGHVGSVHVFERDAAGAGWRETAVVTDASVEIGDEFGQALSVWANTLVVGAPGQDEDAGAAYVFARSGPGSWTLEARLALPDRAGGDRFGRAVAIIGNVLAVGSPGRADRTGSVYVFAREDGGWAHVAELSGSAAGSLFGARIAAQGDRVLVGAPGSAEVEGSAVVFRRRSDGAWVEDTRLAPEQPAPGFGSAVAFGDGVAVVGAPRVEQGRGAAFAFARDREAVWHLESTLIPDETGQQQFGIALALDGDVVWVGAPTAASGSGAVDVFRRDGGAWTHTQRLAEDELPFGAFGWAVAVRGEMGIVGAPGAAFFEGTGFVFAKDGSGEWHKADAVVDRAAGLEPIVGGEVACADGTVEMFACSDVDLISFLPISAVGPVGDQARRGILVNDVWGWTDPETQREYALVGRVDATAFVDITEPASPVYLGELMRTEGAQANIWRDIKVYQNHAYIVSDGAGPHGIQVFDLTELRSVANPPVKFAETGHYDGIFSAHNIVINEETGFAYAVGSSMGGETCGGGLHMVDIRDPANPVFAGCFADPSTGYARSGYSHDAQCIVYHGPDEEHRGKEICFGANETALSIADVTDKQNTKPLAAVSYPNVAYAHQGWVSDDHGYFFMNDEGDELSGSAPRTRTIVWDITDLDDPVVLTEYLGETAASDHNLYVRGNYVYESNYVAGLRIIDISDPANPREVGYFDTVPFGENAPGFAGTWSNYPFFESGTIVVTSMREGLFLLKQRERRPIP